MQKASSRIWTLVAEFILYDDNQHITDAPLLAFVIQAVEQLSC